MAGGKVLFLTVGTGNIEKLEETLFTPLRKSILDGQWREVVLLPSCETAASARHVCEKLKDINIVMESLPEPGLENDVDKSYAHFEKVIGARIGSGTPPQQMVADFTRGTKAMGAALVLAAYRHNVSRLRYIVGLRDGAGNVQAGTEEVHEFFTAVAGGHRLFDQARLLMKQGNFAAVLAVLPDPDNSLDDAVVPRQFAEAFRFARAVAAVYGAWDRLDYEQAEKLLDACPSQCTDAGWQEFAVGAEVVEHLRELAKPRPTVATDCASWVRVRAADLLANGERRIRDRQFEDAYLRAYRVLELVGQARLFAHGLDSARLPLVNEHVKKLQEHLKKRGDAPLRQNRDGDTCTCAREQTARLLRFMGDPIGSTLLRLGAGRFVTARNTSLLIHGFSATTQGSDEQLRRIYADLEALLIEEHPDHAAQNLAVARRASFGPAVSNSI